MISLGTGGDFLTSHEEIVGESIIWVILAEHGIKWSSILGIFVKHVEVGIVLLLDNFSELLFGWGIKIFLGVLDDSSLSQKLDSLSEGELDDWVGTDEGLECELFIDGSELLGESLLEIIEDVVEEFSHEVEKLEIVLLDFHLEIESGELAHVSVGE